MADSVPRKVTDVENIASKNGDLAIELYCDPCGEDGKIKPVEGFCVECQHYLCDNCFKYHCLPKPMRHHRLLGKSEIPKKKVAGGLSEICSQHEGEIMKYYCKSHEAIGCNSCMIIEHKPCHEICTLADIANSVENSAQYKEFCTKMEETNTELEKQIKIAQENIEISKSCREVAISNINELQKKIYQQFEFLRQQIMKEAEDIQNSDIRRIEDLEEAANSAKEDLQNLKDDMQVLEETKQSKQLFIAIQKSTERVRHLERELNIVKKSNKVDKYSFVPNEFLTSMLKNVDALGELCIHGEGGSAEDLQSSFGNYPEYGVLRGLPLSDKSFVLLDTIYNRVRLYAREKNKFTSEKRLTSCPWDSAIIDENKFAVTMPNEMKIKILSVADEDFTDCRDISVDARCEGIECSGEKFFVACNKPAKVLILDMAGTVIQNISSNQTDDSVFQQPAYIAYNEAKAQICITDRKANCVVTMTTEGKMQSIFRQEMMKMPLGIIAENDKLLISAFETFLCYEINLTTGTCECSTSGKSKNCGFVLGKTLRNHALMYVNACGTKTK